MNKNKRYPALFMAPGVLIYGVFFILPVLIGVWYSFTNWNFTRADFVGLMNYKNIISDPSIKRALLNTIIFTVVTTVGKVGLGLALAVTGSSTCATICAESASSRPSSVPLPLALSLRQFCIPTACSTSSSARSDWILWRKTG